MTLSQAGVLVCAALSLTAAALWMTPQERRIASYATSLQGRNKAQRQNAIRALKLLSGSVIEPGVTFSFNRRVGSFSRDDGYRKAPVSYNGQLIDSWGGGVCQSSTTLYNAALLAGMRIAERHRHEFCPSYVPPGRDAAVAYNDIDLKFVNPLPYPVRLQVSTEGDVLRVDFLATSSLAKPVQVVEEIRNVQLPSEFSLGTPGRGGRVRNSGKPGYSVRVYRMQGGQRELVSTDCYPAMNRVVDFDG